MTVTIKQIEDAIIAALKADAVISGWKTTVLSADDLNGLGERALGRYPLIGVIYAGAPEGGPLAGGTGAGIEFVRPGEWEVAVVDKNLRGGDTGRHGDPVSSRHPGAYAMVEAVIAALGYKAFDLMIRRLEYAGDDFFTPPWDDKAVGYVVRFTTQWETTCAAD